MVTYVWPNDLTKISGVISTTIHKGYLIFAEEKNADDYIMLNKVQFSINDFVKIFNFHKNKLHCFHQDEVIKILTDYKTETKKS